MSDRKDDTVVVSPDAGKHAGSGDEAQFVSVDDDSSVNKETYAYSEDRKIGVTGAVFLILNKMIGTGSKELVDFAKAMSEANSISQFFQHRPASSRLLAPSVSALCYGLSGAF